MASTSIRTFDGNIGIGTNDPGSYALNVNGSIKTDSLTVNGITNADVPIGLIVLWSGTVASIPTGWTLCDGVQVAKTDGSGNITPPDLRAKFVKGAYGDNPAPAYPGQTGGADTVTLSTANLAPHSHGGTTDAANAPHTHGGTTDTSNAPHSHGISDPSHRHTIGGYISPHNYQPPYFFRELNPVPGPVKQNANCYYGYTGVSGQAANAPHTHTFTTQAANAPHTHTFTTQATGQGTAFSILPSHYVLAYIMKH
jgi:microcystin-dependent protein